MLTRAFSCDEKGIVNALLGVEGIDVNAQDKVRCCVCLSAGDKVVGIFVILIAVPIADLSMH